MPVWRPRLPAALRRLSAWFTVGAALVGLGAQTPPVTLLSDLTPPLARDSDPTAGVELAGRLVFFAKPERDGTETDLGNLFGKEVGNLSTELGDLID